MDLLLTVDRLLQLVLKQEARKQKVTCLFMCTLQEGRMHFNKRYRCLTLDYICKISHIPYLPSIVCQPAQVHYYLFQSRPSLLAPSLPDLSLLSPSLPNLKSSSLLVPSLPNRSSAFLVPYYPNCLQMSSSFMVSACPSAV